MRHLRRAAPRHLVHDLLPTTVNNKDNVANDNVLATYRHALASPVTAATTFSSDITSSVGYKSH